MRLGPTARQAITGAQPVAQSHNFTIGLYITGQVAIFSTSSYKKLN